MKYLTSRIRTTEERDKLNEELDILLANLYEHKGAGLESALRTQVRSWVAEDIRANIPEHIEEVEKYLKGIKTAFEKLPVLKLTIAFDPTDSSIDKFLSFARKNVSEEILLELEVNPLIFGGCEITYKGEFRDFSLKRLFETEYKAKEEDLMKIVNKK